MKGLADLGLPFVIELTNVFKHRHSAGIGLYGRNLLSHLLAYLLCLRTAEISGIRIIEITGIRIAEISGNGNEP